MILTKRISSRFLLLGIVVAIGLLHYWPSVYKVADSVINRQGSSHGVFIPLLSGYFIYLKWSELKTIPQQYCLQGAIAAIIVLGISLISPNVMELQFITCVFYIAFTILFCFGKQIFKITLFPVLFTISMVPIPRAIYDSIADMTRHITFGISLEILSLFNIPFYRDGWLIKLPNALLKVATSCSGIRYLISYFFFGIAYAYLFRSRTNSRVFLVLSTIPISLAASSLRLTAIFLATHYISPKMAEHWPHVILSWIIFFLILSTLIFLDQRYLDRIKQSINMGTKT